jgi:ABC-type Fe3+/spermidine/putrescine transport system ATPase subunit
VLLLDEPFAALDAKIRVELRDTVRRVQRSLGMTTILVTHDQEEAFALGDRIGVMDHGRLIEIGRPEGLYRHPACSFVAKFLGSANLLRAELARDSLHLGSAALPPGEHTRAAGVSPGPVVALLRPEDIEIVDAHERLLSSRAFAAGTVEAITFAGSQQRVRVALANTNARVEVTRASADDAVRPLPQGRRVLLGVRRVHVLPDDDSVDAEAESEPEAAVRLRALQGEAA